MIELGSLPDNYTPRRVFRNRFPFKRLQYERLPDQESSFDRFRPPPPDPLDEEINTGEAEEEINSGFDPTEELQEVSWDVDPLEGAETASTTGLTSGVTSGAAGTANLGTSLATGAAVGGGAVILGGVISSVIERTRKHGYTLPNSEFIGPGNPIPIGAAKDEAEQTAKDHDAGYRDIDPNKDFHQQVKALDEHAIEEFGESPRLKAQIGKLGLQAKRKLEDALGYPLYPRQTGCK